MGKGRLRNVLLVTPDYHCGMVESAGVWMPLGLASLAGSLRLRGFDPCIYDAMSRRHDLALIRATIARLQPDVVATTACTATLSAATDVLRAAKEALPFVTTVIGGVHPTHMATQVLRDPAVDYVVRREGEATFPELLECLSAGDNPAKVAGVSFRQGQRVEHTADRPFATDLDALPVAWDLIDWPIYHYRTKPGSRLAIASWSRGCSQGCTFCSQRLLWRQTWRARDVDAIAAEARMLRERFGVDTLEVADEYPSRDRARWERILDRLIEEDLDLELLVETRADDIVRDADIMEKYRAAGILHMYVGVESVRQDRLDAMHKDLSVAAGRQAIALLNDAGIITETSFLLGFPEDTPATVEETVRLALDYGPDLAFFLAVTPWPYTPWYQEVRDRVEVFDYRDYNLINPIIRPDGMTRGELADLLSRAFMTFYAHKMGSLMAMSAFKRAYMRRVSKLLMEESYLAGEVKASMATAGHAAARAGVPGQKVDRPPQRVTPLSGTLAASTGRLPGIEKGGAAARLAAMSVELPEPDDERIAM
jgi:anaerobic magnesium-protoporphyrin IX monomethyl ester cyclase